MLYCGYENQSLKRTQKQRDLWSGSGYVENLKKLKWRLTEIFVSTYSRIFFICKILSRTFFLRNFCEIIVVELSV